MEISAIGTNLSSSVAAANSSISQEEFIKLFLTQLTYQDPMKPVDNSQFLAQLASFSTLEQQRINGENTKNMAIIEGLNQGVNLVGRNVEVDVNGKTSFGTVTTVEFSQAGPRLTVNSNGQILDQLPLSSVRIIRQ